MLRGWVLGGLAAAAGLLAAVWAIAALSRPAPSLVQGPPFFVGHAADMVSVVARNLLVLALHALACVAGFIAGSSLPAQARAKGAGRTRWVYDRAGRLAILFVVAATIFSLSAQALVLGLQAGAAAGGLHTSPGLLVALLLPHALPELTALFLPLAAWIIAGRRGEWEQLLAATLVTVAIAVPTLVGAAGLEVYATPRLFALVLG